MFFSFDFRMIVLFTILYSGSVFGYSAHEINGFGIQLDYQNRKAIFPSGSAFLYSDNQIAIGKIIIQLESSFKLMVDGCDYDVVIGDSYQQQQVVNHTVGEVYQTVQLVPLPPAQQVSFAQGFTASDQNGHDIYGDFEEHRRKLDRMEVEIADLKKQLKKGKGVTVDELLRRVEELSLHNRDLNRRFNFMRRERERHEKEKKLASKEVADKDKLIQNFEKKMQGSVNQLKDLQRESESLNTKVSLMEEEQCRLLDEKAELFRRKKEQEETIQVLQKEKNKVCDQLLGVEQKKQGLLAKVSDLESQTEDVLRCRDLYVEELKRSADDIKEALRASKDECRKKELEIKSSQVEMERINKQKDDEIDRLRRERSKQKKEIKRIKKQNESSAIPLGEKLAKAERKCSEQAEELDVLKKSSLVDLVYNQFAGFIPEVEGVGANGTFVAMIQMVQSLRSIEFAESSFKQLFHFMNQDVAFHKRVCELLERFNIEGRPNDFFIDAFDRIVLEVFKFNSREFDLDNLPIDDMNCIFDAAILSYLGKNYEMYNQSMALIRDLAFQARIADEDFKSCEGLMNKLFFLKKMKKILLERLHKVRESYLSDQERALCDLLYQLEHSQCECHMNGGDVCFDSMLRLQSLGLTPGVKTGCCGFFQALQVSKGNEQSLDDCIQDFLAFISNDSNGILVERSVDLTAQKGVQEVVEVLSGLLNEPVSHLGTIFWRGRTLLTKVADYEKNPVLMVLTDGFFSADKQYIAKLIEVGQDPRFFNSKELQDYVHSSGNLTVLGFTLKSKCKQCCWLPLTINPEEPIEPESGYNSLENY